jgi:hypothetical protein
MGGVSFTVVAGFADETVTVVSTLARAVVVVWGPTTASVVIVGSARRLPIPGELAGGGELRKLLTT